MLTKKQRLLCEILVNEPQLTYTEAYEKAHTTAVSGMKWRKMPEFIEEYKRLCRERFGEMESLAIEKLGQNIKKGHEGAIEYCLDKLGYKAIQEIKADVSNDIFITIGDDEE